MPICALLNFITKLGSYNIKTMCKKVLVKFPNFRSYTIIQHIPYSVINRKNANATNSFLILFYLVCIIIFESYPFK